MRFITVFFKYQKVLLNFPHHYYNFMTLNILSSALHPVSMCSELRCVLSAATESRIKCHPDHSLCSSVQTPQCILDFFPMGRNRNLIGEQVWGGFQFVKPLEMT